MSAHHVSSLWKERAEQAEALVVRARAIIDVAAVKTAGTRRLYAYESCATP